MNIPNVKFLAGRGTLLVKKHSPAILTTVGILGGITTVVLASKATLKLEETVEETSNKLATLNGNLELEVRGEKVFDSNEIVRAKAKVYTRGALDVVKLYAPALSVGALSITCIISAQGIMNRRNAALVAAYSALDRGFAEYRKRVSDEVGEELEYDLYHDVQVSEVKNEDGTTSLVKKPRPNDHSGYGRFFDQLNPNWSKVPERNLYFLICQQNYMNDLLQAQGHVFLNEVYDRLELPRTPAGQVVGWVKNNPDGDNYIDFGMHDPKNEAAREFVNGYESAIFLDFNVDGTVYDKI